jgi:hypothetical protein
VIQLAAIAAQSMRGFLFGVTAVAPVSFCAASRRITWLALMVAQARALRVWIR